MSTDEMVPPYSPRRRLSNTSGGGGGAAGNYGSGVYPFPARLRFCPGGITYNHHLGGGCGGDAELISVHASCDKPAVLAAAKRADDRLRQYSLLYHGKAAAEAAANTNAAAAAAATAISPEQIVSETPHFLPSLSVLAEAVFGRLTGCPADSARAWADDMVLSHYQESGTSSSGGGGDNAAGTAAPLEPIPATEEDILHAKPSARTSSTSAEPRDVSVTSLLKRLLQESEQRLHQTSRPRRPCGYVFKRGDIAWNCRTCQADPTCVICDDCFRDSNHEGHEVYFHRTTPGGCCDCGDVEAWNVDGCCERHRPAVAEKVASTPTLALDDPMEAVRMAATARQWAEETLTSDPATHLPPRLMAALGVVVGAAVQCLLDAVDGSGVGADCVQWSKRWADEAARIANAAPHNEDYYNLVNSNDDNNDGGSSSP